MEDNKLIFSTKKHKGETAVVSARLPIAMIKEIDDIARVTGRTRNEIIQMCLEFAIENTEIKE